MGRYHVIASWWVTAKDKSEAINMVENAVALGIDDSDLDDSEVDEEGLEPVEDDET